MVLATEFVVVFQKHQAGFDNVEVRKGVKCGVKWV
jgi:hypothetical protein